MKQKPFLKVAVGMLLAGLLLMAARPPDVLIQRFKGYLRVADSGELLFGSAVGAAQTDFDGGKFISNGFGSTSITSGNTTASVTVSGIDTGDLLFVTPTSSLTTASKFHANILSANTFEIELDVDPEATVSFSWMIVGQE